MPNKEEVVISVRDVSKRFSPSIGQRTIKEVFTSFFSRNRNKNNLGLQPLKNISFNIKKGDFFGIVGRNGSGKSTLLKMIAGVYTPSTGVIAVEGKLVPFIELGVGFNPELSGKDNVYLNGSLLGFSRREMEGMYDEIVDFAELHDHMDKKLKNFSSGMQVRLAFSIAVRARADILLIDEVLAVGDYNFQQKCYEYFRYLKKTNKTVILVSHDTNALQMFCNKGVLIEKGVVVKEGNMQDVLSEYARQNINDQEARSKNDKSSGAGQEVNSGKVITRSVSLLANNGKKRQTFAPNDVIEIRCKYVFNEDISSPVFGIVIQSSGGGQPIFASNTLDKKYKTKSYKNGEVASVSFFVENRFNDGKYYISGAVASHDRSELFVRFINSATFTSSGWNVTAKAAYYPEYEFEEQVIT